MAINEVLNIILPIVFILVGIALVLFIVELIKTVKYARTTIDDIKGQLDPTLKNVQRITDDLQPVIKKVDPLVERVQLTVDSVNLELMRVDGILEDVSEITDTASSATNAVDKIAGAPLAAVSGVASKIRNAFGDKTASAESAQLAEQRVAVAQALKEYENAEGREKKSDDAKKRGESVKGYQESQRFEELERAYAQARDRDDSQDEASHQVTEPATEALEQSQEAAASVLDGDDSTQQA